MIFESSLEEGFEKYYGSRWPELKESLEKPFLKVAWPNREAPDSEISFLKESEILLENAFLCSEQPRRLSNGLLSHYLLNPASVAAALSLEITLDAHFLDLCSAPGGKALVLRSQAPQASFYLNDLSPKRLENLKAVFAQYFSIENRRALVFRRSDGSKMGLSHPEKFSHILCDVPCSAEVHHLDQPQKLQKMTLKASRFMAMRQYCLLCSAFLALKPGGRLVYATCSISPYENEFVLEKFIHKKKQAFLVKNEKFLGDPQIYGYELFPDRYPGWGPIYYSVIEKKVLNTIDPKVSCA